MLTLNIKPWIPAIDLQETEEELILKAQLPGVRTEELKIRVEEKSLTIAGEHQERHCDLDDFLCQELHHGMFSRVIDLPVTIDCSHVMAELVNGILTVVMLKNSINPVIR
jgi:HSP20 family protein